MSKIEEAREILKAIGMPEKQQSDLCCLVLLAMLSLDDTSSWSNAESSWIRIHDIIEFIKEEYKIIYAENSRETIRKQAIHHFRNAAIIEDNGKATNSPNYRYSVTGEALELFRTYASDDWSYSLSSFLETHERLIDIYASKKVMEKIPVEINGVELSFSPGEHNELQKAIIEEFAPRFAPQSQCIYVGDTVKKDLVKETEILKELGFSITLHDKMPDVVLYRKDKDWVYFVESVTSVGPMDPKRILEITELTQNMKSGRIFVTAFLDFKTYKKFSDSLAWETEVWIAELPNHMIHLNGDKFLGPR
ncbi:MAG TPA: restriction endonuclease [Proteiniclasticum sp.]|uniref:BsuBI/PstI family type II restriction endonuclease n=1 Tax=Proteiniclasticum sp. TaxID=2053595 RepID=UPI000E90F271|nr:BsuBI/PstI family type II restriction endonuclease [Proteiniclasticum sp.]HBW14517.1 restriction endonuclease [Proteiniclasticum sp.]